MTENPEPELLVVIKGLLGPVLSAAIGLAWRRTAEIRRGERPSWRAWLLDAPSVIGIGLISGSIALWLELPLLVAMGIACAIAHVGTEWLLAVLLPRLLDRWVQPRDPWASGGSVAGVPEPEPGADETPRPYQPLPPSE